MVLPNRGRDRSIESTERLFIMILLMPSTRIRRNIDNPTLRERMERVVVRPLIAAKANFGVWYVLWTSFHRNWSPFFGMNTRDLKRPFRWCIQFWPSTVAGGESCKESLELTFDTSELWEHCHDLTTLLSLRHGPSRLFEHYMNEHCSDWIFSIVASVYRH